MDNTAIARKYTQLYPHFWTVQFPVLGLCVLNFLSGKTSSGTTLNNHHLLGLATRFSNLSIFSFAQPRENYIRLASIWSDKFFTIRSWSIKYQIGSKL